MEKLPAITMNSNSTTGTINEINKEALPNNGRYTLLADENGITVKWDAYNGNTYSSNIIDWPETLKGNQSFKLSDYIDIDVDTGINTELSGLDFTFTYNVIEAATLDDVIASINGTYVYCSPYNSVGTRVYSDDGSSIPGISFSSSISYRALLASEKNMDTHDDLFIEGSAGGVLNENNLILDPTDTSSADKWVFEFQMPNIGTVKATSTSTIYYSYWRDPNKNWWNTDSYGNIYIKTYSPTPNNGSLDSVINSLVNPGLDLLNDTDDTGGYVEVSFNLIADSPYSLKDGSTQTNVGSMTMQIRVTPDDTIEKIKDKLSKIRGIDIYAGNNSTNAPSNTYYYAREDQKKGLLIDSPVYQSVIELNIQSGANENQAIKLIYKSLNNHSLGINNANALTREASENAISQVANALSIVSEQRSLFGAYQNRLEHARYNVDNMAENTQAAESKMRDTDMAKEMVEYAKQQILQQANHSLLSQANQISERVLVLLK